ncbi:MAG TPA: helix-turn-helix domain-containing protein [Iamia sp.]|nr:helix-turn-helix domain-containing protein [Iamia sp.]
MDDLHTVLVGVGSRLRGLRLERGATLAEMADTTGISTSTLSRLESGQRRPTLELLLPLARAYQVALDDLVGAPPVDDPRVPLEGFETNGKTIIPLSPQADGLQAFKMTYPVGYGTDDPPLQVHDGYEWAYVLSGRLRLRLGPHDVELGPGEAAEFDTRVPHAMGNAGDEPLELLSLFGPQGERLHVRGRPNP